MSEDFLLAIEKKTLLKELLKNEDWEKQFRSSLKVKDEQVIKYLVQEEVLCDMIQALINEEGMTLERNCVNLFLTLKIVLCKRPLKCLVLSSRMFLLSMYASEFLFDLDLLSLLVATNRILTFRMRLPRRTWARCSNTCTATR
jgi:hypothetical protein